VGTSAAPWLQCSRLSHISRKASPHPLTHVFNVWQAMPAKETGFHEPPTVTLGDIELVKLVKLGSREAKPYLTIYHHDCSFFPIEALLQDRLLATPLVSCQKMLLTLVLVVLSRTIPTSLRYRRKSISRKARVTLCTSFLFIALLI
jgi:hypothetical protein